MTRPARDEARACVGAGTLLFLLALAPRLAAALLLAREPVWDGHYYHFGATRIAAGLGYSEDVFLQGVRVWKPWCHYPVGYSATLAAAYRVLGSGLWVAPTLNAVFGALVVVLTWALGRRWLGERRGRLAAALVALHPGHILYSALVMNELLSSALALMALLVVVVTRGRWRGALGAGVVFGVAALVRPPLLLGAALSRWSQPRARGWLLAGLTSAAAVVTVLPWTARNCATMDGCAFISTNGGWNLMIGAVTQTGRFTTLRSTDGCPVVTGQVQQDRCWAEEARRRILADPGRWVSLIPKKLSNTFDHESFAVGYLREAAPGLWPEPRVAWWRELISGYQRLLTLLAPLGLVAWPSLRRQGGRWRAGAAQLGALAAVAGLAALALRAEPPAAYLAVLGALLLALLRLPGRPWLGPTGRGALALLGSTTLTHAVFFGDDRYHVVLTPVLALLTAAALRRSAARAAARPDGGA